MTNELEFKKMISNMPFWKDESKTYFKNVLMDEETLEVEGVLYLMFPEKLDNENVRFKYHYVDDSLGMIAGGFRVHKSEITNYLGLVETLMLSIQEKVTSGKMNTDAEFINYIQQDEQATQ